MSTADVFEARLRELEQADGVPRVGLAGWGAEVVIDGEAYEVSVVDGRAGGCGWAVRRRGFHQSGGVEASSPAAWHAGFDAVDAHRARRAEALAVLKAADEDAG